MTFPTKDELLAGLKTVRENICAYSGGRTCDCKYGPMKGGTEHGETATEHTGCPEVSTARSLLELLTEAEYEALVKRVLGGQAPPLNLNYVRDLPGAHAALDRANVPNDPSYTLVARIEKLAAREKAPKMPTTTWTPLSQLLIGEVFETTNGERGRRVNEPCDIPNALRVYWLSTDRTTNVSGDLRVMRHPHEVITAKSEPERKPCLLSNLTIGEPFKAKSGRAGVRVENTNHQSTYLGVRWEDGGGSHEPPSMPVWPIKTLPIATLPVPGLFAKLREMGAEIKRDSFSGDVRLSIAIDPKKQWSTYRHDLAGLTSLITFAKRYVPGPWFVDLEIEEAASMWLGLDVLAQTQLRAIRPSDAPPGFMFSFCGVDVCEGRP